MPPWVGAGSSLYPRSSSPRTPLAIGAKGLHPVEVPRSLEDGPAQPPEGSTWNIDRETYLLLTRVMRSTRISVGE